MAEEAGLDLASKQDGQIVTPWDVEADDEEGIDYDKLIDRFGSQRISDEASAPSSCTNRRCA